MATIKDFTLENGLIVEQDATIVGTLTANSVSADLNASDLTTGTVPVERLGTGTANSGTYLAGDNTWQVIEASGGGISWSVKTANYTAVAGEGIIADTTAGSFTVTLPASPIAGDNIEIADGGSWSNNSLIIDRNGSTIEGYADNFELDIPDSKVEFIYDGSTWQVYTNTFVNFYNDDWLFKSANYTARPDDHIIADTANGSFTVTLPAVPALGNHILIADGADFTVNSLIINPNGNTIEGDANNLTIDVSTKVDLIYDGATWKIQTGVSPNVFSPYPWLVKTANYSSSINDHILADTTSGSFTITLPGSPTVGSHVYIADGGDWGNNALIVDAGAETIEGVSNSFSLDVTTQVDFVYDGSTWQLITPVQVGGETNIAVEDTNSGLTHYVTLTTSANNGISTINVSTNNLTFTPSTGTLTATDFNSSSDISLKDNIVNIENSINKVNAIRGVNFDWKETGKHAMGVIAQEVEQVIPEVVNEQNGIKSVNYQAMVGLLIEAIKDQQKQIDELKGKLI